jgi:hypothetical protein
VAFNQGARVLDSELTLKPVLRLSSIFIAGSVPPLTVTKKQQGSRNPISSHCNCLPIATNWDRAGEGGTWLRVMVSQVSRPRNALKHGGYSNLAVLPGEDPAEFDRHYQNLITEFAPSGPTEHDTVLDIAKCMWRKAHLGIYPRAARARERWGPILGGPDTPGLVVDARLTKASAEAMKRMSDTLEFAQKLSEAQRELSPHVINVNKKAQRLLEKVGVNVDAHLQDGLVDWDLAEFGELITQEALTKELELEARLEARIDRLLKRLFYLKAAKQTLGLTSKPQDVSDGDRRLIQVKA